MNPNLQNKSRSTHIKASDIYNKEYHDCPDQQSRKRKAADIASGNGKCWWIHSFIMANDYVKIK